METDDWRELLPFTLIEWVRVGLLILVLVGVWFYG